MIATTTMSVTHRLPVIGIPADVREVGVHPFNAVGEKYVNAIAHGAGALPLLIPAFGPGRDLDAMTGHIDLDDLMGRLDGVFLSGGPSNVEPHHYGGGGSAPGFALGVQWHPEWRVRDNPFSLALFTAFGDAARARAAGRTLDRTAATLGV